MDATTQDNRARFDAGQGPRILGPDDGKAVDLGSVGVRFMAWAEETGGGFSLVEHPIPPKTLVAPLHFHEREDEYSFVLEGRMGAKLGDDVVYAEVGDFAFKPREQWHTFWNPDDTPCRILEIIAPGGFEHFFEADGGSGGRRVRPREAGGARRPLRAQLPARERPGALRRARSHPPDAGAAEGLRDRISAYAGSGGGSARPQASTPPSTRIVVPVMNAPPGLARNATVSPTSAAVPSRPSGTVRRDSSSDSGP